MPADSSAAIDELLGLYAEFGSSDYIGEAVTQTQHALQAAKQAENEGYGNEVILGAFFHDIGHLIGEKQGLQRMVTGDVVLGVQNHAERGREYLESVGVVGDVSKLVGMHVQAKRYLVATDKSYYNRLSEASKMTLQHQGGPMTDEEVDNFTTHPLRDLIITMRTWDERAKDPQMYSNPEVVQHGLKEIRERLQLHVEKSIQ